MKAITVRLKGVIIEKRPALEVIARQDSPQTLFYVDPPYLRETRGATSRYPHEMTDDDHMKLAEVLGEIEGMAILSGYASDLYEELYGDWRRETRLTRVVGAARREEVLWISPNTPEVQMEMRFSL